MKDLRKNIFICSIILAIIITGWVIFGGLGIGAVLTTLSYLGVVFYFANKLGKKQDAITKGILVAIILDMLCFGLFSSSILTFFNILFLILLIGVHALMYFGECEHEVFSFNWCKSIMMEWIKLPFINMMQPFTFIKEKIGKEHNQRLMVIGKVLFALVIAVPILLITMGLLIHADAAFEGTIRAIIKAISNIKIEWPMSRIAVGSIIFFMMFSYFYSLLMPNHVAKVEEETQVESLEQKAEHVEMDFTIVATVVSLVGMVYLLFGLSQFTYFISAFQGILPEDFSSAEYARRGFFEALPIIGINLGLIMVLNLGTKIEGSKVKQMYIKGASYYMIAFSGFMAASALAKMFMYMKRYGLTQKRIYVAWFLILMLISLGMIVLKLWTGKLNLVRNLLILVTVMYLGLNFANVDYIVGSYNITLYEKGVLDNLDACYGLNSAPVMKLQKSIETYPGISSKEDIRDLIDYYKDCYLEERSWQEWNVSDLLARKALRKL